MFKKIKNGYRIIKTFIQQRHDLVCIIVVVIVVGFIVLIWCKYPQMVLKLAPKIDKDKNRIDVDAATILSFFAGLFVTIVSVYSARCAMLAHKIAKNIIASEIHYEKTFFDHINTLSEALDVGPVTQDSAFYGCLSSLAYGTQARFLRPSKSSVGEYEFDTESYKKFFKFINKWLDAVELHSGDVPKAHLNLSCWNRDRHDRIFACQNDNKKEEWIKKTLPALKELNSLLYRIRTLRSHKNTKKLTVEIRSTEEIDYRLFMRREGETYRGMMTVMPPLTKYSLNEPDLFQFATVVTRSSKGYDPFLKFYNATITCPEFDNNITNECLDDPEKFIKDWFNVDLNNISNTTGNT